MNEQQIIKEQERIQRDHLLSVAERLGNFIRFDYYSTYRNQLGLNDTQVEEIRKQMLNILKQVK